MSVCVLQNLEKYRVLWTDFSASCREINQFSVSKIGPELAKPTISIVLLLRAIFSLSVAVVVTRVLVTLQSFSTKFLNIHVSATTGKNLFILGT